MVDPAVDVVDSGGRGEAKRAGRGKAWKDEENLALTRAVGTVGHDSINGADQKGSTYWARFMMPSFNEAVHQIAPTRL